MMVRRVLSAAFLIALVALMVGCGPSRENLKVEDKELLGGAQAGDFAAKVAEAEELWAQREDRAKLEAAIAAWEAAVLLESSGMDENARRKALYDVYVNLSHAYYLLADGHVRFDAEDPDDVEEPMKATYDLGVTAAEKALYVYSPAYQDAVVKQGIDREDAVKDLDAGAVPAMYWYATNLGKWALLIGLGETLGHVDTIFAMMTQVEALGVDYWYHGPYRYFGAYYTKLPFPGGDADKSKEYFEKVVASSPNYVGGRVLYAEYYAIKVDDEELFKTQLQMVLDAPDDIIPELRAETLIEKKKAKILLDNIDDHF